MPNEYNLKFQSADPQAESVVIEVERNVVDGGAPDGFGTAHLYILEGSFTWSDIACLARQIQQYECPDISAMDYANAQRGGTLTPCDEDGEDV